MMAGMTPIRTSLRANVVASGGDRDVAGRDETEPTCPRGAVDPPDDRLRRLPHRGRGSAADRRGRPVAARARPSRRSLRSAPEQKTDPVAGQHDDPHGGIRERRGQMAVEVGDELPRQRVADSRRVEVMVPTPPATPGAPARRHRAVSFGNCPGRRPSPGGPAKACASRIHSCAAGPVIRSPYRPRAAAASPRGRSRARCP